MVNGLTDREKEMQHEIGIALSEFSDESKPKEETSAIDQARIDMNKRTIETLFPDQDDDEKTKRVTEFSDSECLIFACGDVVDETMIMMGLKPMYSGFDHEFINDRISKGRKGREETIETVKITAQNLEESEESKLAKIKNMFGIFGGR